MTNFSIGSQLPVYLGLNGSGLNNGKVYIGLPGQDPQTFPKTVYWDEAGTVPVDQTNGIPTIGGYITRAGSPATIFAAGAYSIRLRDRYGSQIFYFPEVSYPFSGAGGATLVGFSHAATNTGHTIGQRLAQEIWVTDAPYNADPSGVADSSTAFQNAINALKALGGGTLRGKGVFKINTSLEWPAEPAVVNFRGEGFAATKLVQGTANTPIIKKVSGVSRIVGAQLIDFTVQAHASSVKATATNILIDIAGFDSANVRVAYLSDPAATSLVGCAYAVVSGHANNGPCYQNKIYVKLHQTAGPEKGVWLHNGGATTSLANANCNEVTVWAYALSNLVAAVDGADTTQMIVKFSILEDCPGATGVIAGNFTVTRNNWFELMAVAINYGATAYTLANNCVSISDQFSGTNKIVIHSSVAAPPRFNDPLLGGMTFENQSAAATTNYVMPTVAKAQPAPPSVSFVLGGGTIVPDSGDTRLRVDHHGVTTSNIRFFTTSTTTGRAVLQINTPSGFDIEQAQVSAVNPGVTAPVVFALTDDRVGGVVGRSNWEGYLPSTANHTFTVRVTMRAV